LKFLKIPSSKELVESLFIDFCEEEKNY